MPETLSNPQSENQNKTNYLNCEHESDQSSLQTASEIGRYAIIRDYDEQPREIVFQNEDGEEETLVIASDEVPEQIRTAPITAFTIRFERGLAYEAHMEFLEKQLRRDGRTLKPRPNTPLVLPPK